MELIRKEDIDEALKKLKYRYYKLILVVGPMGSGKTDFIKSISLKYAFDYINLNLELSEKLINIPVDERCYYVEDFIDEILAGKRTEILAIDNIVILFGPHLKLEPLRLFKNMSKYRGMIVAWGGDLDDGYLTYARPGHLEFRKYSQNEIECMVIKLGGKTG
ncbi:BREX-3 system P-loop-containing protein BrxF [Caldanaerobius polysaccharolyticus]|uniref:BREX-3 system P-loop-containing protein BrxF n=1 Tax=Caldanaerobius polysaccharolyticus TaxID=44256 RepID=UPI00047CAEB1|nr:BREX-3 system P-loop-containing protein BrxF [Caldanaerobius polysaccharolyticus]